MARIFESDILLLLLLGCCNGSFGSSVQLYPFTKETHSDCSSGFVHGLDRYIYRATLNTTNQDLRFRSVVNFEVKSSSSSFFTLACQVIVYPLSKCDVTQPSECYCRNTPNSIVEVFFNKTADIQYSNGTLRIYWPNFGDPDEASEKPIPIVYPDVVQILKVNNKILNLDTCSSELNLENLIQYCVSGLSSHNLFLNFSSLAPIQSPDECVNHTYILSHTVNESSPIKFSVSFLEHDGCQRTQINECYLHRLGLDVSTTTATTLNTTFGCCIGSFGSSVQLYPFTKETHSDCSSHFVHGLDRYIYRATLNTTNQNLGFRSVVNFEVKSSSSSGFTLACQVIVYPLSKCDVTQPSECYCRNTPNSIVEVFFNKTADIQYSNGTLRIYWPNFGDPDEASEKPIPIVYPDVVQILKVNNKILNLDTCSSELNLENLIQYCVSGLSSHNLFLNFSSLAPIQSPDECVNHTYISSHTVNESSPIKFSVSFLEHDGCQRTQINECYLHRLGLDVSTMTATTLNTTFVSSSSTLKNLNRLFAVLFSYCFLQTCMCNFNIVN